MVGAVSHDKSLTAGDWTGTVTVWQSNANTVTIAASDIVKPSNWNSAHDIYVSLSGNTANLSNAGGGTLTNVILAGGNNVTLSMATAAGVATVSLNARGDVLSRYTDWGVPGAISSSGVTAVSASMRVLCVDQPLSFTNVAVPMLWTFSSTGNASTFGRAITSGLIFYTNNAGTLSPVAGAMGTTTVTWASNSSSWSENNGARLASFPISTLLTPNEYFVAFQFLSATTVSSGSATFSMLFRSDFTASQIFDFGVNSTTGATTNAYFVGLFSSTISATNQTLAQSNFTVSGTGQARANIPLIFRNL